jgi:DNA (cytosine-5)-methyltransferase 1
MIKIKLLDLCCKAGGCSMGYFLAAQDLGLDIEITGVDIEPQPNYSFNFIQADAVEYLKKHWQEYTHIHASPPCQPYTRSTAQFRKKGKIYNDILQEIRVLIIKTGLPGIIENVPQAPIRGDIILRGDLFGLKVIRKRHFELINWFALNPFLGKINGTVRNGDFVSVYGKEGLKGRKNNHQPCKFMKKTVKETWGYAMGIDWMKKGSELAEAIPPAYTRYIGNNFFKL